MNSKIYKLYAVCTFCKLNEVKKKYIYTQVALVVSPQSHCLQRLLYSFQFQMGRVGWFEILVGTRSLRSRRHISMVLRLVSRLKQTLCHSIEL